MRSSKARQNLCMPHPWPVYRYKYKLVPKWRMARVGGQDMGCPTPCTIGEVCNTRIGNNPYVGCVATPLGNVWQTIDTPGLIMPPPNCPAPCTPGQNCFVSGIDGFYECRLLTDGTTRWFYEQGDPELPFYNVLNTVYGASAEKECNKPRAVVVVKPPPKIPPNFLPPVLPMSVLPSSRPAATAPGQATLPRFDV